MCIGVPLYLMFNGKCIDFNEIFIALRNGAMAVVIYLFCAYNECCYTVVYWSNMDNNQNGHVSSALWHRAELIMDVYLIIGQDFMALRFDFC